MKEISYLWNGNSSLREELSKSPERISVLMFSLGFPLSVVLWHSTNSGIRIASCMHDVGFRHGIGVLQFAMATTPLIGEEEVDNPLSGETTLIVRKLVYRDETVRAESGLILSTENGREIRVVAGAMPYTLAVGGIALGHRGDEPEYDVSEYHRTEFG
ncbi:hypothetical protein [Aestuariivirga sp.]|uniref:hypothetical protein n=1 Tax=Aestuariivirga sp. TaxID=2650926 RepID=UPI003592F4E9